MRTLSRRRLEGPIAGGERMYPPGAVLTPIASAGGPPGRGPSAVPDPPRRHRLAEYVSEDRHIDGHLHGVRRVAAPGRLFMCGEGVELRALQGSTDSTAGDADLPGIAAIGADHLQDDLSGRIGLPRWIPEATRQGGPELPGPVPGPLAPADLPFARPDGLTGLAAACQRQEQHGD